MARALVNRCPSRHGGAATCHVRWPETDLRSCSSACLASDVVPNFWGCVSPRLDGGQEAELCDGANPLEFIVPGNPTSNVKDADRKRFQGREEKKKKGGGHKISFGDSSMLFHTTWGSPTSSQYAARQTSGTHMKTMISRKIPNPPVQGPARSSSCP